MRISPYWQTKMTNGAIRLASNFLFLTAAIGAVFVAKVIDNSFPVISNFTVTSIKHTASGIILEGDMKKDRDCTFNSVTAYTGDGRKVHVNFLDRHPTSSPDTRPVRVQLWGPWEVYSGTAPQVSMFANHSCHMFWSQTTKLIDLPTGVIHEDK